MYSDKACSERDTKIIQMAQFINDLTSGLAAVSDASKSLKSEIAAVQKRVNDLELNFNNLHLSRPVDVIAKSHDR